MIIFNFCLLSLRLSSMDVVLHWFCFTLGCLPFKVIFQWSCLPIKVIFHWSCLQLRSSSYEVVFHLYLLFTFVLSISSYFTTISVLFWMAGWMAEWWLAGSVGGWVAGLVVWQMVGGWMGGWINCRRKKDSVAVTVWFRKNPQIIIISHSGPDIQLLTEDLSDCRKICGIHQN